MTGPSLGGAQQVSADLMSVALDGSKWEGVIGGLKVQAGLGISLAEKYGKMATLVSPAISEQLAQVKIGIGESLAKSLIETKARGLAIADSPAFTAAAVAMRSNIECEMRGATLKGRAEPVTERSWLEQIQPMLPVPLIQCDTPVVDVLVCVREDLARAEARAWAADVRADKATADGVNSTIERLRKDHRRWWAEFIVGVIAVVVAILARVIGT